MPTFLYKNRKKHFASYQKQKRRSVLPPRYHSTCCMFIQPLNTGPITSLPITAGFRQNLLIGKSGSALLLAGRSSARLSHHLPPPDGSLFGKKRGTFLLKRISLIFLVCPYCTANGRCTSIYKYAKSPLWFLAIYSYFIHILHILDYRVVLFRISFHKKRIKAKAKALLPMLSPQ